MTITTSSHYQIGKTMETKIQGRMVVRFNGEAEAAALVQERGPFSSHLGMWFAENPVGSTVRFRRLGDLLGKGERPLGIVAEGTFELVEFLGTNGLPLITENERAVILAKLEKECLENL
jgi:hypothetical protein